MRVLLPTLGSYGDVHPFVGLGVTLKRRGHEVIVIASSAFERLVLGAGLGFAPRGNNVDSRTIAENPDLWHPRKGLMVVMDPVFGGIDDFYRAIRDHHRPGATAM